MQFGPDQNAIIMNAFALISQEIKGAGYTWRIEKDFQKVRREIEAAGKDLTPFFWTNYYDFNGKNAFCVVLEKNGQGLSYICIQRFDLGDRTLEQAYVQRLRAIYAHDHKAKLDSSWVCEPLQEITGAIAYSGDAVNHPDLKKLGRVSLRMLSAISRLSLFIAQTTWPDIGWIVGSINERDISRGLAWVYGGNTVHEMVEKWEVLPEQRNPNYAIVTSSRAQILWKAKVAIEQAEDGLSV